MIQLPATRLFGCTDGFAWLEIAVPEPLLERLIEACDDSKPRALRELAERWAALLERMAHDLRDGSLHEFVTTRGRCRS